MRTDYVFTPKSLIAEAVQQAPPVPRSLDELANLAGACGEFHDRAGLQSPEARTVLAARYDDDRLYLLIGWSVTPSVREGLELAEAKIPIAGSPPGDMAEFFFDTRHDHTNFKYLTVYSNGRIDAAAGESWPVEYPWLMRRSMRRLPRPTGVQTDWHRSETEILCRVSIRWPWLLGRKETVPPCMGLNVLRTVFRPIGMGSVWQDTPETDASLAVGYGHLYIGRPELTIQRIDLPMPVIGRNEAIVTAACTAKAPEAWRLEARTWLPPTSQQWLFEGQFVQPDADGKITARCEYFLSPQGTWLVEPDLLMRLRLQLRSESGLVVPVGSWPWSVDNGLIFGEAYGCAPDAPPPDPADPDFAFKKRMQIVGRIPRFVRKTTAQGAPSDFYIESTDGSVAFNLMQPGVLQEIADWLYGLFDNDADRLLGATMFVHQRSVTRHSGHNPAGATGPLSLLRGGTCLCGDRANVLSGILSHMRCDRTGRNFEAYTLGMYGHVVTAVAHQGDFIVLDPDTASLFFSPDHSRPATLTELRTCQDVVMTGCVYTRRHGHDFYYQAYHQRVQPFRRSGIWPDGAPPE